MNYKLPEVLHKKITYEEDEKTLVYWSNAAILACKILQYLFSKFYH